MSLATRCPACGTVFRVVQRPAQGVRRLGALRPLRRGLQCRAAAVRSGSRTPPRRRPAAAAPRLRRRIQRLPLREPEPCRGACQSGARSAPARWRSPERSGRRPSRRRCKRRLSPTSRGRATTRRSDAERRRADAPNPSPRPISAAPAAEPPPSPAPTPEFVLPRRPCRALAPAGAARHAGGAGAAAGGAAGGTDRAALPRRPGRRLARHRSPGCRPPATCWAAASRRRAASTASASTAAAWCAWRAAPSTGCRWCCRTGRRPRCACRPSTWR